MQDEVARFNVLLEDIDRQIRGLSAGEGSVSPLELKLMYTALGYLSTSLKVLGDSQRAMNARFEANDEAYERNRALHQENLTLLRTVAELRLLTRNADAVASASAKSRVGSARPVSGKARRRRARSQSAAG
jgi:hypothetical protein